MCSICAVRDAQLLGFPFTFNVVAIGPTPAAPAPATLGTAVVEVPVVAAVGATAAAGVDAGLDAEREGKRGW